MSITLKSFLKTHPISLLENLKNVCQEIGLENEGTKPELQHRIIAFTDKEIDSSIEQWNKDRDAEVAPDKILLLGRDLANQKGHDTSKLINRHIRKTKKGTRQKPTTNAEIHLEAPKTTSNQQNRPSQKKRRIDQIDSLDEEENSQTPLFDDENENEEGEEKKEEAGDEAENEQMEEEGEEEDEESEEENMDTVEESDEEEDEECDEEEDELSKTIDEIQDLVDDLRKEKRPKSTESTSSSAASTSTASPLTNPTSTSSTASSPTTETIDPSPSTAPSSCENGFEIDEKELNPMEKKYYFILSQSATILACKDKQIERMASIITQKDAQLEKMSADTSKKDQQIEKLIKMNEGKSQQIDKLTKIMDTAPLAEATQDIKNLKSKQAEQEKTNEKLATIANKTTSKLRELKTQQDGNKSKNKQTRPDDQGKPKKPKETSFVDLTSPIPNKHGLKKTALLIGDSTTDKIEAEKLHEEKEVKIIKRFSLNEAVKDPPTLRQKEQVSDVMIMVGLNDTKDPNEKTSNIMSNYSELIDNYIENFPKAKVHISGVAPISTQQENVNSQLEDLAKEKNVNYVPLQGFHDRNTGIIRPNMVKGNHLTECGTRTLAKSIKSALYGRETRPRETLRQPTNQNVKIAGSQSGPEDLTSLMNSMANFFNTAASKINEK